MSALMHEARIGNSIDMSLHARGIRLRRYSALSDVPLDAAKAILLEHGELMRDRLVAFGGPWFSIDEHLEAFWRGFDAFSPPNGSYYLAFGTAGEIVGTAALRREADGIGEMKHLYVRPEARGTGLGEALVRQRISDARSIGLTSLIADTFRSNPELPRLYRKIGFREVEPSSLNGSIALAPQLLPHMYYYRLDL